MKEKWEVMLRTVDWPGTEISHVWAGGEGRGLGKTLSLWRTFDLWLISSHFWFLAFTILALIVWFVIFDD